MMKKAGGGLLAIALFFGGTLLLVGYVTRAEQRAVSQEQPVEVLVVSQPVDVGDVPQFRPELVPKRLVMDDVLLANDSIVGLVATTDLVPGEQLLWSRLSTPEEVEAADESRVEVPTGFLAVTIPVTAERALGGLLLPGMYVGVVASFQVDAEDPSTGVVASTQTTSILVHQALVVEVQSAEPPKQALPSELLVTQLPVSRVLVTLAVPAAEVERIVYAAEWGSIWFAGESLEADTSGTRIQTQATIFEDPTEAAQ